MCVRPRRAFVRTAKGNGMDTHGTSHTARWPELPAHRQGLRGAACMARGASNGCAQVERPRVGPEEGPAAVEEGRRDPGLPRKGMQGEMWVKPREPVRLRTLRASAHESAYIPVLLAGTTRAMLFSSCERLGPHTTRSFALRARQCTLLSRPPLRRPVPGSHMPPNTGYSSCVGSG